MASGPTILVTGAGGFVARGLVERMAAEPGLKGARLVLTDHRIGRVAAWPDAEIVEGDLRDESLRARLCDDTVDICFHLAGVLGGAAEANYDLARAVNLDAGLSLLEDLRRPSRPPRVIFASSIAVFGAPLPPRVDDETAPLPTMTYGAQKLMIETALGAFSRRGELDGVALRLPGVVARPDADTRLKSAFLNRLFHDFAAGTDMILPVSPQGRTWLLSRTACADNLLKAAMITPDRLGERRAITLPAVQCSMADLIDGLRRRYPHSPSRVRFEPDPWLDAQFAAYPPLATPLAESLGFAADEGVDRLIEHAIAAGAAPAIATMTEEARG